MSGRPSWNNAIADSDNRASGTTCETGTVGVVVPLFAHDHAALLGEGFILLRELEVHDLARWVSALRCGRLPGSGAA
jgi:hypothetical protein